MQITTVRNKPKTFSWSFSKLTSFETCPKRHYHYDVARDIKEPESDALIWGNQVHEALANAVSGVAPLPDTMKEYQKWVDRIVTGGGKILVEQKLALKADFSPTAWNDWNGGWFRGIGDVIKIVQDVALIVDYKTGKIKEDGTQLALMAACVFAHYPEVNNVRSEFIWLKEDATTRADFARNDMQKVWVNILPRVESLAKAHESVSFPPKPGGLCKRWCGVNSCPHNGV
jgi:hypothetical protein